MSFMDRLKGRGRKDRDAAQHEDSSLSGPYSGLEADLRDTVGRVAEADEALADRLAGMALDRGAV